MAIFDECAVVAGNGAGGEAVIYSGGDFGRACAAARRGLDRAAEVWVLWEGDARLWGRRDEFGKPVLFGACGCWDPRCGQVPPEECRCVWADANPPV